MDEPLLQSPGLICVYVKLYKRMCVYKIYIYIIYIQCIYTIYIRCNMSNEYTYQQKGEIQNL